MTTTELVAPEIAEAAPGPTGSQAAQEWRQPPGVRGRTVRWDDPQRLVVAALERSGLEVMRDVAAGRLSPPPVAPLLGFGPTEVEAGRVVFTMEPGEHQYNPMGTVHGGVLSTLLDTAMGCAVLTSLPRGTAYTTTDLQVRFVRPATVDTGLLTCEGVLVHAGSRLATAEGRITDERGRLVAHGTTSCLLWQVA